MGEPFLLLNGDTLFEPAVLRRLLASPSTPIVVSIDRKPTYDADDMKVCVDGTRLLAIGKELDLHTVNGESIGLLLFREDGPDLYRRELENAVHAERSLQAWHLDVVNRLAPETRIETLSVEGLRWWEIDTPEDLAAVRAALCAIRQAA